MDPLPYGLRRPALPDAREAVHRVHGRNGPAIWSGLLGDAGVSGAETDDDALHRLMAVMAAADPVTRLCAEALRIRLDAHTRLSVSRALVRR